jgi:hypothetical protein
MTRKLAEKVLLPVLWAVIQAVLARKRASKLILTGPFYKGNLVELERIELTTS